jgi:hypothetical protein
MNYTHHSDVEVSPLCQPRLKDEGMGLRGNDNWQEKTEVLGDLTDSD